MLIAWAKEREARAAVNSQQRPASNTTVLSTPAIDPLVPSDDSHPRNVRGRPRLRQRRYHSRWILGS